MRLYLIWLNYIKIYDKIIIKKGYIVDSQSIGKLILRIMVGGMLLFHGVDKLSHGIGFIEKLVAMQGLPSFVAYGIYAGEILAPILLLLGWYSRLWGAIIAFNMAAAIYLVHSKSLFALGDHGAWAIELPMLFMLGALAITFLGSGKYAIKAD